jgi:hypothetical protein
MAVIITSSGGYTPFDKVSLGNPVFWCNCGFVTNQAAIMDLHVLIARKHFAAIAVGNISHSAFNGDMVAP